MHGLKSWTAAAVVVISAVAALVAQGGQGRGRGPGQRGTPIQPGEECPPGMTEVRPGSCQAPELPPPSIVDYRPKSTRRRRPSTWCRRRNFRSWTSTTTPPITAENIEQMIKEMDALNLRVLVNLSGGATAQRLKREGRLHPQQPVQGSLPVFANVQLGRRGRRRAGRRRPSPQLEAGGQERRHRPQDLQEPRPRRPQGRRLAAEGRRSRSRSDLAGVRAPEHPGLHPHGRSAAVLPPLDYAQRALARAGALSAAAQYPAGQLSDASRN